MSRATIDRFFDHLENDCQLQIELAALTTCDDSGSLAISEDAFLRLASSSGYQVTSAELKGFLERRDPHGVNDELSDDDLDSVVGGVALTAGEPGTANAKLWQAIQTAI